jgi:hypothetical protein
VPPSPSPSPVPAFPSRDDCEIPFIEKIGDLPFVCDVPPPPPPICEFPLLDFPLPPPPPTVFGCYAPRLEITNTTPGVLAVAGGISFPEQDDTGFCQPVFNLTIGVFPGGTGPGGGDISAGYGYGYAAPVQPPAPGSSTFSCDGCSTDSSNVISVSYIKTIVVDEEGHIQEVTCDGCSLSVDPCECCSSGFTGTVELVCQVSKTCSDPSGGCADVVITVQKRILTFSCGLLTGDGNCA